MRDLNDLYFFAKVVEEGGFAAAARRLGVPRSRLSRRIGLLEQQLDVRLIQRSTRHFAVTDIGQDYYQHCVAMLIEAEAAQEVIDRRRAEPRGIVRVTCPSALLHFQIGDMIARFMAACHGVEVRLENTNRRVDVIGESVDLAFRVRFPPLTDSHLVMRELGPSPQLLVAAPSLLSTSQEVASPTDLARFPSMSWNTVPGEHEWCLSGSNGEELAVRHTPRFVTEDMIAILRAAKLGVGVVQLPSMVVEEAIARGELVPILRDWTPRPATIHMVFPTRRGLLPATRALIDHVTAEYDRLRAQSESGEGRSRP